jgi:hypothetical protein
VSCADEVFDKGNVNLGIPAYRDIAAATITPEGPREH